MVGRHENMSLEELLSGKFISAQCTYKHINALSTEIFKTSFGENSYLIKNIFTKKDARYNLRTSNFLSLLKRNMKRFGLYSFSLYSFLCS